MRNKTLMVILISALLVWKIPSTFAKTEKQSIRIDNDFFQTYNESTGKWIILNESKVKLDTILNEWVKSENELRTVNQLSATETIPVNKPIFIPYSPEFTNKLLAEGFGREIVLSDFRELVWPVGIKNSSISSRLGMRRNAMHSGIDIACPNRSPIIAAADGLVIVSRNQGNYGLSVTIQHETNQLQTLYAHNSYLLVKEGEKVVKGQVIAFSGSTGHSTGPHLHFEVRYQNIVLNPEHYFTSQPATELALVKEAN
jgi:murein DD-endopeptidase MepM/ murein hydrolase activator NlpD